MNPLRKLLIRHMGTRQDVGATGIVGALDRPGQNFAMFLIFSKPAWLLILAIVLINLSTSTFSPGFPVSAQMATVLGLTFVYAVYTVFLEIASRRRPSEYDLRHWQIGRIVINLAFAGLLLVVSEGANSYYWFVFIYPLLQGVTYFQEARHVFTVVLITLTTFVMIGVVGTRTPINFPFFIVNLGVLLFVVTTVYALLRLSYRKRKVEHFEALLTVQRLPLTVDTQAHLQQTLSDVAKEIIRPLEAEGAAIFLFDKEHRVLVRSVSHPPMEHEADRTFPLGKGIAGHVATQRKPYLCGDTRTDPYFDPNTRRAERIRSLLAVPVMVDNQLLGVLSVDSPNLDNFDSNDKHLLLAFASYLGDRLQRSRLLEALRELGHSYDNEQDNTLELILDQLRTVIPYNSASLFLLQDEMLCVRAHRGYARSEKVDSLKFSAEDALFQQMVRTQMPVLLPDAQSAAEFQRHGDAEDIRGWLGVPLTSSGEVIGFLGLDSKQPNFFGQTDIELANIFARHASLAIQRATYNQALEEWVAETELYAEQLKTVNQFGTEVNLDLQLRHVLRITVKKLADLFEVPRSAIALIEEDAEYARVIAHWPETERQGSLIPLKSTLSRRILRDREPLLIADAQSDPLCQEKEIKDIISEHNISSMLIVPILTRGQVVGTIGLDAVGKQRVFKQHELELAQRIAAQLGLAINNARLLEQSDRRASELARLYRISESFSTTLDLEEVLRNLANEARQLVDAHLAIVYTYDDKQQKLSYAAGQDREGRSAHDLPLPRPHGLTYTVAQSSERRVIEDTLNDPDFCEWGRQEGISAIAGFPLQIEEQVLGVLNIVLDRAFSFDKIHLEVLEIIANQAATALKNAIHHQRIQQQAWDVNQLELAVRQLAHTTDVRSTLQLIAKHVPQFLETVGTFVGLFNDAGWETQGIGKSGTQAELIARFVDESLMLPFSKQIHNEDVVQIADLQQTSTIPDRVRLTLLGSGVQALIGLRLTPSDRTIGVILLALPKACDREAHQHKLSLLQLYADQSSVAIERANLFERLREERRLLEEIAGDISAMESIKTAWHKLLVHTLQLTGASRGDISLIEPEAGKIEMIVASSEEVDDESGIRAYVARTQEALLLPSLDEKDIWKRTHVGPSSACSVLAVPILDRQSGKAIGVFYQESDRTGAFNRSDCRLLESAALHAGIAWMYHKWYEQAQRRADYLELALEASRQVIAVRRTDADALYAIAASLRQMFDYDSVILFPYQDKERRFKAPVIAGLLREKGAVLSKVTRESRIAMLIHREADHHFANDSQKDSIFKGGFVTREGISSSGYVRLNVAEEIVGILFVNRCAPQTFTKDEIDAVRLFANLAGLAIYNVRQYSRLQSQLDELKSLLPNHNRKGADSSSESITRLTNVVLEQGYDSVGVYPFDPFRGKFTAPELRGDISQYDAVLGSVRPEGTVIGRRQKEGPDNYFTTTPDKTDDLHYGQFVRREGICASASLRLYSQDKFLGLLFVNKKELFPFAPEDKERLKRLAQHLSKELMEGFVTQRETHWRSQIAQIRSSIGQSRGLKEVLDLLYESLQEMFGVDSLPALLLYNGAEQNLRFLYTDHYGNSVDIESEKDREIISLDEGLCGWVARHRKVVRVADVQRDERYLRMHSLTRSELAVPIMHPDDPENRLIGVLDVESPVSDGFDEQDERWLQEVAAQIATSVWKAEEYKRRGEMLEAFQKSIQPIMESIERPATFQAILAAAATLTKSHLATIQELREDCLWFEAVHPVHTLPVLNENLGDLMPLGGNGMTVAVANSGEPLLENDVSKSKVFITGGLSGTNAALAVPILRKDGSVWGVLNVESIHKNAFDIEHCKALQSLAGLLMVALNNAERAAELRHTHSIAVMGAWGAEIAHDINREISHIRLKVEALRRCLNQNDIAPMSLLLDKIDNHASGLRMPEWPEPHPQPIHNQYTAQLQEVLIQLKHDFDEELSGYSGRIQLVVEGVQSVEVGMHEYWLRRVLIHLIRNAIGGVMEGPGNGVVRVNTQLEREHVLVRVQDTGKGVADELMPYIFSQPVPRSDGSQGRGLLLVSYIINAHKGELYLEDNSSDIGACFIIRLPLPVQDEAKE